MKRWLTRGLSKCTLAGALLGLLALPASAQFASTSGGGASAGGGGGSGAGGGSSGGSSFGSGGSSQSGSLFGQAGTGGTSSSGSGTTTGTTPISNANPFQGYFSSPLASGLGNNITLKPANGSFTLNGGTSGTTFISGKGTFGVPLYGNIKNAGSTSYNYGGAKGGGAVGGGGGAAMGAVGFSTAAQKRTPQYITTIDFERAPPTPPAQLKTDLAAVLAQSTMLQSAKNLDVSIQGQTLVLQGIVTTEKDKRLAEGLIRLTPGVQSNYVVRNDIVVSAP